MGNLLNPFILSAAGGIITANSVFDFDADLGVTVENTDRVINWADQLVNVGDLLRGTGSSRRPVLITNGNPASDGNAIEFDGTDDGLVVVGGFTWNQPETLYLVMKQITWVSARSILAGFTSNTMVFAQKTSTPNLRIYAGTELGLNGDLAVDTWGIVCLVYNGVNSSIRINNNTKLAGDAGTANASGLMLGLNAVSVAASNIRVARILGYDTAAHSDAEQDQNIDALNAIYSVF